MNLITNASDAVGDGDAARGQRSRRGTAIRVLLPTCDDGERAVSPRAQPAPANWRGRGIVLVADDEEIVRNVAREVLEAAGFEVMTTCDGRECVDTFLARSSEISAVLPDMTMPRLGGAAALRELRRRGAEVPVILTSGYDEGEAQEQSADPAPTAFLQKPDSSRELVEALRGLLAD